MLVLQRKANERIHIGSTIVIVVKSIRGSKVVLGILAPPNVKVFRPEGHTFHVHDETDKKAGLEQQTILSLLDCVAAIGIPVTDAIRIFVATYAEQFSSDVIRSANVNAN